ncbi:hypothetical protein [Paraburkholderia pallida]|uniref:Uncharacterized protein n=1 Tax=Paraburkholderia pallida TaxID=2547399 RepID=A0A4P7D9F8_9BURK|nr:hypothetical protein [Paraburkholderia pallida]QBR04077.1 hypothetical protein E1956_43680 [Paraburkholderia pallida]
MLAERVLWIAVGVVLVVAALADPGTGAMIIIRLSAARTDLIAGLAFAGALDCLPVSPGCAHCARCQWLKPPVTPVAKGSHAEVVTAVTPESNAAPTAVDPVIAPAAER